VFQSQLQFSALSSDCQSSCCELDNGMAAFLHEKQGSLRLFCAQKKTRHITLPTAIRAAVEEGPGGGGEKQAGRKRQEWQKA